MKDYVPIFLLAFFLGALLTNVAITLYDDHQALQELKSKSTHVPGYFCGWTETR